MIDPEAPPLGMHEVLKKGYNLESRAFMMTYNSKDFSRSTWERLPVWTRRLAKKIGASKWAACLELTMKPSRRPQDGEEMFHFHSY